MAAGGISIQIDPQTEARLRSVLSAKQMRQARWQIVKRELRFIDTSATKLLREGTNLNAKVGRDLVKQEMSRGDEPAGAVVVSGQGLPIIGFRPKVYKKRGVNVQPVKDAPLLSFKHAFPATMKSGHTGIFLRQKLGVFGPKTTQQSLVDAGFDPGEARQIFARDPSRWFGQGIRHQKRLAVGGNFPDVTPQGFAWRFPIQELHGPTGANIVGNPKRLEPIISEAKAKIGEFAQGQIDRFTK